MESKRLPSHFEVPQGAAFENLVENVKDYALFNGAAMRSKEHFSSDTVQFLPFTLLPSPFPKKEFDKAVRIQPLLNQLIHKVAHNHEFLKEVLQNTIEVDFFTGKLFEIYEIVYNEGFAQYYSVGLLRSDYMVDSHDETLKIKQVEINAIASSFAGISQRLSSVHRFVLERLRYFEEVNKLPENKALEGLCSGLIEAWKIYNNPNAIILIVVENVVYNICDQKFHEFEIYRQNPRIICQRKTLTELFECGELKDKKYFVNGSEVAVVYYRSGYAPDQYPTDKEWDVRLIIERSEALKCPPIHYHLAGTKKIQQALALEKNLKKFLEKPDEIQLVADIFTGLYSLDLDDFGDQAAKLALQNPQNFVLKPQREGGGNNVYGAQIAEVLTKLGRSKERTAYILMNRIQPPLICNYIIRPGKREKLEAEDVISELGIFGVIIGTKDQIIYNKQAGHMLRTKGHKVDEGGVSFGAGSLDSPFLY